MFFRENIKIIFANYFFPTFVANSISDVEGITDVELRRETGIPQQEIHTEF